MTFISEFFADGATIRFGGRTTGAEVLEAKRKFFGHKFEKNPVYVLCDFTHVEKLEVSADDIERIVSQDLRAAHKNPALAEVIIAPEPHQFGLARMWEQQVTDERPHTHVTKTREGAIQWLKEQDITVGG
ncbi:MAG TPA: hypothetical protein VGI92_13600 [Gemmatimonadales bacterium]|jgi:hypothetical protein